MSEVVPAGLLHLTRSLLRDSDSDSAASLLATATALSSRGHHSRSAAVFRRVLDSATDASVRGPALNGLALAEVRQGQLSSALKALEEAASLSLPASLAATVLENEGIVLGRLGRSEDAAEKLVAAAEAFEKAAECSSSPRSRWNAGRCALSAAESLRTLGRLVEAELWFRKAIGALEKREAAVAKGSLALTLLAMEEDDRLDEAEKLAEEARVEEEAFADKVLAVVRRRRKMKSGEMRCWSGDCEATALLQCSRCREARYCSKRCQMSHWSKHRENCKKDLVVEPFNASV